MEITYLQDIFSRSSVSTFLLTH